MLYVLRLSTGDCVVAAAEDETGPRSLATSFGLQDGEEIVSVRPLPRFAVRLSPTDSGSLEVSAWDDSTLDDILAHEYPILNEALQAANSVRFMPPPTADSPILEQLKQAHERNAEIIRAGLERELARLGSASVPETLDGGK
jgi:hypothetical protein